MRPEDRKHNENTSKVNNKENFKSLLHNEIRSDDQEPFHVSSDKQESYPICVSTRLAVAVISFLGFVNLYAQRVNMSVAIVCMVNNTALEENEMENNGTSMTNFTQMKLSTRGEFDWDKRIQGFVLGSFFYGYIMTQLPGGWLSTYVGGKRVLGWSMLVCSIATILIPVGARFHYGIVIALRITSGLGQGVVFPATHTIWANWAPPAERSRLIGYSFAGTQLGSVIAMPISGLLCEYGFDNGWPSIFYVFGTLGVIWFIAWMIIVSDTPATHPRINEKERLYIEDSLRGELKKELTGIPWLSIVSSLRLWAIVLCHTCWTWGFYTFLTNMPTFLKEVLKFDLKSNGFISALPYLAFWLVMNIASSLADFIRVRQLLSLTWIRKLFNSIGMFSPIIFLLVLGHLGENHTVLAVTCLILGVGITGAAAGAGFLINPADIAPSYAGIIFGISNTFATVPGFLAPLAIGELTTNGTQAEWQNVFYLSCGFYLVGGLFYLIAASGEMQPWALQTSRKSSTSSGKQRFKTTEL